MSNVFNVFIGRFQPAHNAHLQIIRGALESKYDTEKYQSNPNHVIVCIGSAYKPRTPRDPFSAAEREEMLRSALSAEENKRVHCAHISESLYNNTNGQERYKMPLMVSLAAFLVLMMTLSGWWVIKRTIRLFTWICFLSGSLLVFEILMTYTRQL